MDGQGDPQDSQITSSEDTLKPQVLRSNVAERPNLQSFLEKMNATLNIKVEVEKTSCIIKTFPWLKSFQKLCRSAVGSSDPQLLYDLMSTYLENVSRDVINCYMKPIKAGKLKRSLNETLVFFHTYYSNLEKPMEQNKYLDMMSDLVAMYMDMEIKASRRGKESLKKVSSKIISALYVFLDSSLDHIYESIMKSKFFIPSFKDICIPILKRVAANPPLPDINEMTYVSRILILKLWKRLVSGAEEKRKINMTVSSIMPPSNFSEMLKYGLLANVLPPIPRNMKGTGISHFLARTKLNLKDSFKAFVKMSKDSKRSDLVEVFDKSRFFRDCQIDEDSSTLNDDKNGSMALIDSIWQTISNSEPEITSCFSLFSVFNSVESENVSLFETSKKNNKKKKQKCKKKKGKISRDKITKSKLKRKLTNKIKKRKEEKVLPKEFEEMMKKLRMVNKLETTNVKNSYNTNEEENDKYVKTPEECPEIYLNTNKFPTTSENNGQSFSVGTTIENKTEFKDNKIKSEFDLSEETSMTACNETVAADNDSLTVLEEEKENINKNVLYKNGVEVITQGNTENNCSVMNNCKDESGNTTKDCVILNECCKAKDELSKNKNDCSVKRVDQVESIENSNLIRTSSSETVEIIEGHNVFHYKPSIETDKVENIIKENCGPIKENQSNEFEEISPNIIPPLADQCRLMEEVSSQQKNNSSDKEYNEGKHTFPEETVLYKTEDCSLDTNSMETEELDNKIENNSYSVLHEIENCVELQNNSSVFSNKLEFEGHDCKIIPENNYSTTSEEHSTLQRDFLSIGSLENEMKQDSSVLIEKLGSAIKACKITNIDNLNLMDQLIKPENDNTIEDDDASVFMINKLRGDSSNILIQNSIANDIICLTNYNTNASPDEKRSDIDPKKTPEYICAPFTPEIFDKNIKADSSQKIDVNSEEIEEEISEKVILPNTLKNKISDNKNDNSDPTLDFTDSLKMSDTKDKKNTSSKSKNNKNKHSNSTNVNSSEFKNTSKGQNSSGHKTSSKSQNSYGRSSKNVNYIICNNEPNTTDSLRLKFQRCDVKNTQSILKHNQSVKTDVQSKRKNHKSINEDLEQGNNSSSELQTRNCIIQKAELLNKQQLVPTSTSNKVDKIDPADKSIIVTNNPDISGKVFVQSSNKNGVTKLVQLPVKNAVYINIGNDEKLRKQVQIKLHKLQDGVDNSCKTDNTTEFNDSHDSAQKLSSLVDSMDLSPSNTPINNYENRSEHINKLTNTPNTYEDNSKIISPPPNHEQTIIPKILQTPITFQPPKPQSILKVKNFESMCQNKNDSNKSKIKKYVDTNLSNFPNKTKEGQTNSCPEFNNIRTIISNNPNSKNCDFAACEEYAALKNHIYSDKPYSPPKKESLKEFTLNTSDMDYYGPNLNLATNSLHNSFTPQLRQFLSKENIGYTFSENDVQIPNESTFNTTNSLEVATPYIPSNTVDSYSECILRSPHTESLNVDSSALCLVVDKNVHKEDDFEMNMFPVAQEIEVCSAPFSNWGYTPFPDAQDVVERRDDWCNVEENSIIDTSQKYSQGLFLNQSTNEVYFSPSSAKTVDNNLKRKHTDIERLLRELSNMEHISTNLTLKDSLDPEKLNLHKRTVSNDFNMCSSQHKFKDYCLTDQGVSLSIPVPSPPQMPTENFQSSVRCPCSQCHNNHGLLFNNNSILTQYKNAKIPTSLDLTSRADETLQVLDKDHSVELDCSLPLKKRKTLTLPPKLKGNEMITSYPNTPMISIAELDLTNFKPTTRGILPNPQSQVLQNSANELSLETKRIMPSRKPKVLQNSASERSLQTRGIPNSKSKVLQNSASELSLQAKYNLDRSGGRFKTPAQLKEHPGPTSDMTLAAYTLMNFSQSTFRQYKGEEESQPVRKQNKKQKQSMSVSNNMDLSRFNG